MREGNKYTRQFLISSDDIENIHEDDIVMVGYNYSGYHPPYIITSKIGNCIKLKAYTDNPNIGVPKFKEGVKLFIPHSHDSLTVLSIKEDVTESLSFGSCEDSTGLIFTEEESKSLYRIMGHITKYKIYSCQVYAEEKPKMRAVWHKVIDWGRKNLVDIHGDK